MAGRDRLRSGEPSGWQDTACTHLVFAGGQSVCHKPDARSSPTLPNSRKPQEKHPFYPAPPVFRPRGEFRDPAGQNVLPWINSLAFDALDAHERGIGPGSFRSGRASGGQCPTPRPNLDANRPMHPPASLDLGPLSRRPRDELAGTLAELFPRAIATETGRTSSASIGAVARGGRAAAVARLAAVDPVAYARSRNHVAGAVTMLSPWIRHGVLSLAEVRDAVLSRVARPEQADKLVSELGWRDYWRQVHAVLGDGILSDIEPPAVVRRTPALDRMPEDVLAANTGMACIDAFVHRLNDTGWLHNHERMWLASWLVHVRGVHWRVGADWFLRHLLDGDPASNHLSWQWVAGTFAARPYLFNRENLETFTSGIHCRECPLLGRCDVEGSYEDLSLRLFDPTFPPLPRPSLRLRPVPPWRPGACSAAPAPTRPLVWLTLDSAAPTSPAAVEFPSAPRLFVIDPAWLDEERPSLARLVFLFECLADVPGAEIRVGPPAEILPARVAALGCDGIAVADSPCPRTRRAGAVIAASMPVVTRDWPTFCDRSRVKDLGRFSRYWQAAGRSALTPTPA